MVAGGGMCGGGVEDVMAVGGWIVRRDRDTGEGGPQAAPAQPGQAGEARFGGAEHRRACGPRPSPCTPTYAQTHALPALPKVRASFLLLLRYIFTRILQLV